MEKKLTKIYKSILAQSRDEWLASDEGKNCLEGTASGLYLRNRLVRAFLAGAKIGERIGRETTPPRSAS